MSASFYHADNSRVDSALSLPLAPNNRSSPDDIALQSRRLAMPEFGPWSQVNTRLEHDAAPVHQPQVSAHVHNDSNRPLLRSSRLRNGLATVDSALNLQLLDAQARADCTSPLYTHLPSPPVAATPSPQMTIPGGESCLAAATIRCGQCRAEFTGTYRRGNLARHVRQKHTWRNKTAYPCTIAGCNKSFARSDARSKHAQKHHPDLCPEPVRRGHTQKVTRTIESHGNNNSSMSYHRSDAGLLRDKTGSNQQSFGTRADMEYATAYFDATPSRSQTVDVISHVRDTGTVSITADTPRGSTVADHVSYVGQWLPEASQASSCEGEKAHSAYFEPHQDCSLQLGLCQSTRTILCRMHAELGTANFVEFVDAYFTRWESIVQYMRDTNSAAYPLYSQGLHDLYAMVRSLISITAIPIDTTAQQYRERQPHGTSHAGTYHNPESWSNSSIRDPLGMSSGRDVQLPNSASRPDPINRTTVNRTSKRPENLKLNCPRFKWFKKHGGQRPCHGCQGITVAKVRYHCNRTSHHQLPSFAKQCRICQRDFVNAQAYQAHTSARPACDPRPQARGDITAWVRLYLAYYPNAVRVVSPYEGNDDYLPDDTVARCRLPPVAPVLETRASTFPFLDRRYQHSSSRSDHEITPTLTPHAFNPIAGQAAVDFMVQDAMSLIDPGDSAGPSHAASLHGYDALQTVAYFSDALRRRPPMTHQQLRGIVERAHVAAWQLRGIVEMAEAAISVYDPSEQLLQIEHRNRPSADSTYQLSHPPRQYLHPADAGGTYGYQYPPTASGVYHDPTGMSTQPSSQGFDSASSAYLHSTETRPSSVQSPEDPILHSLSASPSLQVHQRSLAGAYPQALPGPDQSGLPSHIDPVLLQQSSEWSGLQDGGLGRHVWYGS